MCPALLSHPRVHAFPPPALSRSTKSSLKSFARSFCHGSRSWSVTDMKISSRWTREKQVSAVVLDIDTQGEDPYGGLPVLTELRRLNPEFTLISVSRARARSVEKEALSAGADAHFRNPVDVPELRMVMLDSLRRRVEDAERERSRQQVTRGQQLSGLHRLQRADAARL